MNAPRFWLTIAGLLGALGVGLGAYGAHGLEKRVRAVATAAPSVDAADKQSSGIASSVEADVARRIDNWKTAVHYQMTHVAALLAIGLASARWPMRRWCFAGAAMLAGMVMFSGMLYYEALAPERRLGIVVMFGGISYIVGWLLLAWAGLGIPKGERT
ncbi:MAG: DUF423 domain-containing protein [Pirellulales bacterium]